jgi:hypothetical protein
MPESALVEEMQPRMIRDAQQDSRPSLANRAPAILDAGLRLTSLAGLAVFALTTACVTDPGLRAQEAAPSASSSSAHGITVANMDPSIKPGDNFYLYANGTWINRTQIPPDRPRISVFSVLDDLSRKQTADLIEAAAKSDAPEGSNPRKIAALYNSFMNEPAIEAKGLDPLTARGASSESCC